MSPASSVVLEELMAAKLGSVDPSKHSGEVFDLYSIPAFDRGQPDVLEGCQIGSSKQIVEPGDVLLSRIVPHIRRAWVVGQRRSSRLIASGEWIVFRSKRVVPGYLRHLLVGDPFHAEFMRTVSGVGGSLLRARPAYVAKIQVALPSIPEQRRIAEILDKADVIRAKRRAALVRLDLLTQTIFLDMFGNSATNTRQWPRVPLAALCEKVIDCPHATPIYAAGITNFPCLRSSDIQAGELDLSNAKYVARDQYEMRVSRGRPEIGDVVYCREGARFGNAALIREGQPCLGQRMMLLRANRRVATSEYLWAFLNSPAAYRQAAQLVGGSASPHVNIRDIVGFKVPNPPIDLQIRFSRLISAIEQQRLANKTSFSMLNALVASLQHRAFLREL